MFQDSNLVAVAGHDEQEQGLTLDRLQRREDDSLSGCQQFESRWVFNFYLPQTLVMRFELGPLRRCLTSDFRRLNFLKSGAAWGKISLMY